MKPQTKATIYPCLYEVADDGGCTEPSGYLHNAAIVCNFCAGEIHNGEQTVEETAEPFFSSEETDFPVHCDTCGILIPSNLTTDGEKFVKATDGRTRYGKLMRQAFPWVF